MLAAADELWRSGIIRPDAEPTAVMVTITRMLHGAFKQRAQTIKQARDVAVPRKRVLLG